MSADGGVRALSERLFRWGGWRSEPSAAGAGQTAAAEGKVVASKAMTKFLSALSHRDGPVLLDLGPVVGSNVAFFGDRLGCKLLVEDVYADVERFAREDRFDTLPAHLETRFTHADASVDGVLCWDLFDYLGRPAAQVLAAQLTRILKPHGALLAFFATTAVAQKTPAYTKFVVVDDKSLQHKPYPGTRAKQPPIPNRDINLMFQGLRVSESFLLLTNTREMLLRKPDPAAQAAAPAPSSPSSARSASPKAR